MITFNYFFRIFGLEYYVFESLTLTLTRALYFTPCISPLCFTLYFTPQVFSTSILTDGNVSKNKERWKNEP